MPGRGVGLVLLSLVLYSALTMTATTASAQSVGAIRCAPPARMSVGSGMSSTPTLQWRGDSAVRWSVWPVTLGERSIKVRVVVVDIDPTRLRFTLEIARDGNELLPWSLDAAPADARIALNAGQFTDDGPWGWVVHRGREWQAPGTGALAGSFSVDSMGRVSIRGAASLDSVRTAGGIEEALQSFPMLLENGRPSALLCAARSGLDRTHRDIRFAIGVRADGHLVLALSRYDGLGNFAERLPIGPTTMEMAELMRRLGATHALMLDGGISAQLLIRDAGIDHRWQGLRRVPLALVGRTRSP